MSPLPVAAAVLASAVASACAAPPPPVPSVTAEAAPDEELRHLRQAIEAALTADPPRGYAPVPDGVRLLSIARRDSAIVLDLSPEILAGGIGPALEDALHLILAAASNARPAPVNQGHHYTVLIDGTPLETHIR